MMFHLHTYRTDKGTVVAACDAAILGDTFEEDGVRLSVTDEFYGGDEVKIGAVVEALQEFTTANLAGNDLIDALIDEGLVEASEVMTVDGVKHVQLFRL